MTVIASMDLGAGLGPVHFQGKRPTCLAFALSDMNRQANKAEFSLSPEYLYRRTAQLMPSWQPHGGLLLQPALNAVANPGQPIALAYPYVMTEPIEKPPILSAIPKTPPGYDQLYASNIQSSNLNAASVEAALLAGDLVGLIIAITDSFYMPVSGEVAFSTMVIGQMLHAVVATGLGRKKLTNELYVRIRNTWGAGWGDAGNAWLPFSYLDLHIVQTFKV